MDWQGRVGIDELAERIVDWARGDERIRAMVAFGSLTRHDRPGDDWSDIDALFIVDDRTPWDDGSAWVQAIAPVWLHFLHPAPIPGLDVRQVLFAGGYDADLVVVDRDQLAMILGDGEIIDAVFGRGFRIEFDRDDVLIGLASADAGSADRASGASTPTQAEFDDLVGQVLYQLVWATKRWRRGEIWRTVDDLDDYIAKRLLRMQEWVAVGRGARDVQPDGRRLEVWAGSDQLASLATTFSGYDPDEAARTIQVVHETFRALALEVAGRWGFSYPVDVDGEIGAWIRERLSEA